MVNAGREFLAPLLAEEDLKLREPEGIRLLGRRRSTLFQHDAYRGLCFLHRDISGVMPYNAASDQLLGHHTSAGPDKRYGVREDLSPPHHQGVQFSPDRRRQPANVRVRLADSSSRTETLGARQNFSRAPKTSSARHLNTGKLLVARTR
jgi:hypothetical protein